MPVVQFLFTKKTILFISNKKIISINFHPILQTAIIALALFFGLSFYHSWQYNLQYNNTVDNKSSEIDGLKKINNYFANELEISNKKLEKINQYLNTVNSPIVPVNNQSDNSIDIPKKIETENLNSENQQTINTIKQIHQKFSNINHFNLQRIKKIEQAITVSGLNFKNHFVTYVFYKYYTV